MNNEFSSYISIYFWDGFLVWVSNIDGKLGSGSLLELTNLSVGNHIITVSGYGTKIAIQITIFHDLWALYQSHLSQHEISSIMGDFAMNLLDDSVSGESWKCMSSQSLTK